jgi:hypothetical protein
MDRTKKQDDSHGFIAAMFSWGASSSDYRGSTFSNSAN